MPGRLRYSPLYAEANSMSHISLPLVWLVAVLMLQGAGRARAGDWPRFRGPNGLGVSETTGLPLEFGPGRNVVWKTKLPAGKSSPALTSALTARQGRLPDAVDDYYSSPIGVDGKVSVLKAAGDWPVLATNDFGEEIYATPAVSDGRIYLRTMGALEASRRRTLPRKAPIETASHDRSLH